MKKLFLYLSVATFATLNFIDCSSDDNDTTYTSTTTTIKTEELPVSARNFVTSYFSNENIKLASKNSTPTINNSMYTALLNNGFEIDFDSQGNWTEIESKNYQAIPENFLTEEVNGINTYVKSNYPSNWIVTVEKEHYGYSVELNNDLELIFNQNQEFVGIDMDDNDNESIINYTSLPKNAKDLVSTHFPNAQYVQVKKEIEKNNTYYKVYLSTGYKIEFDSSGNWTEIESKTDAVIPSALILPTIESYINTNYSGYSIQDIEKGYYGYKVEIKKGLNYSIELMFDANGLFLGIDN